MCGDERGETVEIPLVCAVTELRSVEYDVILPADVVCELKATQCTSKGSSGNASVGSGDGSENPKVVTGEDIPEDVCSVPVTNVEFFVSGGDVNEGFDVKVEVDSEVNREDNPEDVDKSVVGIEVCVTGRDVNDNDVVRIDDVLTSTPARVSCIVPATAVRRRRSHASIRSHAWSRVRRSRRPVIKSAAVRHIATRRSAGSRRRLTLGHVGRGRGVSRTLPLPPTSQKSVLRPVVHVVRGVSGRQSVPRPVPA